MKGVGVKLGLDRIRKILARLGDPQDNYKIIHVGGTNGKGSVCRFINSILVEAGYRVGLYTSPHLVHFKERFLVNNSEISEKDLR
ncbi:MAG: bifunctional folylpolyglutamate synthase/dihydrofolate synthase, partial [Thermoprotei archaeon]